MTQQPPPGPGFGPPPPQYAPAPPPQAPAPSPYAPAQPYAQAPQQQQQQQQPMAAGPDFLAVDKRNAVVVDASGVAFETSGLTVEFRWPEIRGVHYRASPDGKALMVAVVHMDGRFYECVVEARPRTRLQEWFPQLAWVLGHYRPVG
ncbi:hypothetical protein SAMN06272771_5044 [Streptomyces sp. Ag82_O1-12]|uniref:hypothetical protein n=1 Tax=unclassified Streptomyces TaxID=2593676 RepID=UPI000BCFFBD7|nr:MULTISPECIES: hypothetical protein [unclassified Streptomyces]SMQ18590.1 hypothetical protein SAMN06272771_5044 [Streptomyces sp. Ag82_O1-12]SOD47629.1 hypothetical protein SAMN06272727_5045 [Streptomyces sp. Ag82_G6-1]